MHETKTAESQDPLLYVIDTSPFGTRLRLVNAFLGTSLPEAPPPGGAGTEAMKAISHFGKMPAITIGGRTLIESLPLMEYLVERAGGHRLVPDNIELRAAMRGVMLAHDNYVLGAIWPMFLQLRTGMQNPEIARSAMEEARVQYGVHAEMFSTDSDFAIGQDVTLADLAMAPFAILNGLMYSKFGLADPYSEIERLTRWKAKVMSLPEVSSTLGVMQSAIIRVFG